MSTPCHALVFRDVRERVSLSQSASSVIADLQEFAASQDEALLLSALLRAGEIECAIADTLGQQLPSISYLVSRAITDIQFRKNHVSVASVLVERLRTLNEQITISRPEGFAFYGIHPSDYLDAVEKLTSDTVQPVIIGIRSIGLTLGAFLYAALRLKFGDKVEFLTLRPSGHPYDRKCEFVGWHARAVERHLKDGRFIIVDEGPGLSGSSFLSVGETLVGLGVNSEQIVFLCSRKVDSNQLVTPNGAQRWSRFKSHVVSQNRLSPEEDAEMVVAGDWRKSSHFPETLWPGLWTSMLPPMFRSGDRQRVFEYHGLGHYGDAVRLRINSLADADFTLPVKRAANGFSETVPLRGCRLSKHDLAEDVIEQIAQYLALRPSICPAPGDAVATQSLEDMARFNFHQATGVGLPADFHLPVQRPAIADAQMMPHTWFQLFHIGEQSLLKLDCGTHGDNHFYPGPVDIAWDVAGAMVEWEMDTVSRDYFITRYNSWANDDIHERLEPYIIAYAAFRNGYCRMAASAMAHDPNEQSRLLHDGERYRRVLQGCCARPIAVAAQVSTGSHE